MADEPTRPYTVDDLIAAARLQAAGAQSTQLADDAATVASESFAQAIDDFVIAGYDMVRELSRGGQGVVFEAVQLATKRRVAIKVMLHGALAGAHERQRFEREVEILAQLKHPNIVTIHDSGIADGKFYYVMDFIPGQTLDRYAETRDLGQRARLELFAKISNAVNAAHRLGVIHRDLKPGNILVNEEGEPLVLDFGLAKTSSDTGGESPQLSVTGQFLGSIPWASPEQVRGVPGKIDLRTDVYALGVILYQLLTGRFPYQVVGAMRDVLDNILEAEPARPSTLQRTINHEVETIVLKCLSKDADRRYQSAGQLAEDVRRYLAGEAIEAKRDSMLYVVRKQAAQHKFQAAVLGLMGVIMLATGSVAVDLARKLWSASREVESANRAARTNTVLLDTALEHNVLPKFEQLTLCAVIAAQQSGRLPRAQEIAQSFPLKPYCRLVMQFLLDPSESEVALLQRLPANQRGMGQFAIGARRLMTGDESGAATAFEQCLALNPGTVLKKEAASYLAKLKASHVGGSDD